MKSAQIRAKAVDGHGPSGTSEHGPSGTTARALRNTAIGPSGTHLFRIALITFDFSCLAPAVTRARVFNYLSNQKQLTRAVLCITTGTHRSEVEP